MQEVFRTCFEDERYEVSNLGTVRNKTTLKILKSFNNGHGYLTVAFWINNNTLKKRFYVHRLVANAFIKNPLNKREVNHIDGNKQNNNVNNLEWVTRSENLKHKFNKLNYTISKKNREITSERMKKYQKEHREEILKRLKYYRDLRIKKAKLKSMQDN